MQSKPAKKDFIDLAKQPGEMGREDCQIGWHLLAARLFGGGGTVLDVGAGLGQSKQRIPNCTTQDPGHPGCDLTLPIEELPNRYVDYVTSFDVIEHVVEDVDFLMRLRRIARRYVFITTPNWNHSKAANGCHCREYTPLEFFRLLRDCNVAAWFVGSGSGIDAKPIPKHEFIAHEYPHQAVLIEV